MSGRFTYQSSFESIGNPSEPDIVYYNASIVNNNTDDTPSTNVIIDPQIRFNETRDTAIIKDASKYQFSIIRFVLNGANKDLPLFIPAIQSSTGQTDVNLTEYGFGITWEGVAGQPYCFAPPITYVSYVSETQNPVLAPKPRSMANPMYVPTFVGGVDVGWVSSKTYSTGQIVYYTPDGNYYQALAPNANNAPPSAVWTLVSPDLGQSQDLSSRYYWVYTYSHWVDMCNTALDKANQAVFDLWHTAEPTTAPTTYSAWQVAFPSPIMTYDNTSGLFSIAYPSAYVATETLGGISNIKMALYLNTNSEGLFANFDNVYLNSPTHPPGYGFNLVTVPPTLYPQSYTNLQVVEVQGLNENLISAPATNPPQGYTGVWCRMTQNYTSTSTLWSPIDSIVFTSTLLPLQNEQTAPPNALGTRNTGNSTATSQSAFTPIITDVALDLSSDPSAYRKMIYYAPSAEYRMADFQNSKTDIRNIDIQVFWKNRLDNGLYPIQMFNLSSVSFKLMFRKKQLSSGETHQKASGGY
jgi:hypothetical protein